MLDNNVAFPKKKKYFFVVVVVAVTKYSINVITKPILIRN